MSKKTRWSDREYRQAYMEAAVEQGIAWQIRINRRGRGMSQAQLAEKLGSKQSAISRLEDPEYGAHSLETLLALARIFDCALIVKFAGYSALAAESESLTEAHQYAPSFAQEMGEK